MRRSIRIPSTERILQAIKDLKRCQMETAGVSCDLPVVEVRPVEMIDMGYGVSVRVNLCRVHTEQWDQMPERAAGDLGRRASGE